MATRRSTRENSDSAGSSQVAKKCASTERFFAKKTTVVNSRDCKPTNTLISATAVEDSDNSDEQSLGTNIIERDLSGGQEMHPVRVVNDFDSEDVGKFQYIVEREVDPIVWSLFQKDLEVNGSQETHCTEKTCGKRCRSGICPCRKFADPEITFQKGHLPYYQLKIYDNAEMHLKECDPNCICQKGHEKTKCGNTVFQCGSRSEIDIFRTMDRGWGVRSRRKVREGEFIGEYTGLLVEDGEHSELTGDYLHGLGETILGTHTCVDAAIMGNFTRFINHSCDPNAYIAKIAHETTNRGMAHLCIFALGDIEANEEILINYGGTFWGVKSEIGIHCLCGSSCCRFSVTGPEAGNSEIGDAEPELDTSLSLQKEKG